MIWRKAVNFWWEIDQYEYVLHENDQLKGWTLLTNVAA